MEGIGTVRLIAQGKEDIFFEEMLDWDSTVGEAVWLDPGMDQQFKENNGIAAPRYKADVEPDTKVIVALVEIGETGTAYGRVQIYIEYEEFEEVENIPLPEESEELIAKGENDGGDNHAYGRKETETIGFPRLPGPLPGYNNS